VATSRPRLSGRAQLDIHATLAAYAELQHGDAERCGCSGCRNFIAARAQAFPGTFRTFLAELGIDPNKEGEAIHYGPVEPSLHFYGGWFYFVGELLEIGERLTRIAAELKAGRLALISSGAASFEYWFCPPAWDLRQGSGSRRIHNSNPMGSR